MGTKVNSLLLLLVCLFFVNFSSAGLIVSDVNLTKTYQVDQTYPITIYNNETIPLYNIQFETNDYVSMPTISQINANSTITANITIKGNLDLNGSIRLIAYYSASLGQSNKTEDVRIGTSYSNGVSQCNLDLIEGDTIIWSNELAQEIKLKNVDSNEYFQTILSGQSYTNKFTSPTTLRYRVYRIGVEYSPICTLIVSDDSGLVHSSRYDGNLNLKLTVTYPATTINATFLTDRYQMSYNNPQEDVFAIRNTGSKIAKVNLESSNWITFGTTSFTLEAGESKTVSYKITPNVAKTSETNITHQKNITIKGNFDTINKQILVFINYKDLDSLYSNYTMDTTILRNLIGYGCTMNPDWKECNLYNYDCSNSSEAYVSSKFSESTVSNILDSNANFQTTMTTTSQLQSEDIRYIKEYIFDLRQNYSGLSEQRKDDSTNNENMLIMIGVIITIILLLALFSLLGYILYKKINKVKIEMAQHLEKGERAY